MPTYYLPGTRKGNRTIVVRGHVDGTQHEITTPHRDKKSAQDYWFDFRRQIRAQRDDLPSPGNETFLDAADLYRSIRPGLSKNELSYVTRLEAWFGASPLSRISEPDVHAAAHGIYPECLPQTKNRQAIAPAAAVLHGAAKKGWCAWIRIDKFRETDPHRPVAMPAQAQAIADTARAAGDPMLAVAVETLAFQGWRIGELMTLERARIDWDAGTVTRKVSKSGKWRVTSIDAEILASWGKLPARDDGRLFPWANNKQFYRAIDKLELGFHYRPHMSRRGFATALKNAGADAHAIAEAGQWEDPRSVQTYIADDPGRQRDTLGKLRLVAGKKAG